MTHPADHRALLVLEDGTTLRGTAFGADGETFGEMVFNTGMTGYQETLTDPSYCRQIVAMTAPHIGNTGVNEEDPESRRAWVSGYVVREPARLASSWRATCDLDAYLRAEGVTGIAVRGTRLLTRRVRERGAMRAAISTVETSQEKLLDRVLASPEMTGADLARVVSTPEPYTVRPQGQARFRVAAVCLGIKILALALGLGTYKLRYGHRGVNQPVLDLATGRVYITSHNHGFAAALPGEQGVPNGPGEPPVSAETQGPSTWAHIPPRARQPFETPYGPAVVSHVNLNDGVVEGLRLLERPVFSVQYHPEAAPGPHDAADHFDHFCTMLERAR